MKTIEATIYKCDHCGKSYQRKRACEKHEMFCSHNPRNKSQCFRCAHLILGSRTIVTHNGERQFSSYQCDRMGVDIYPLRAARKGLPEKYPEQFKDSVQMPNNCPLAELIECNF